MRVPRQWSGADLKKALAVLGYEETRQTGSHLRLTTRVRGEHHVTVPDHKVLPLGTLRSILRDPDTPVGLTKRSGGQLREEVIGKRLWHELNEVKVAESVVRRRAFVDLCNRTSPCLITGDEPISIRPRKQKLLALSSN